MPATAWARQLPLALLLCAPGLAADTASRVERRLELGGLVTLDHASGPNPARDPELGLGQVALGANVNLAPEVMASVLLKAQNDLHDIFFDQAMASFRPADTAWSFLFGQFTHNHGLLTTRLISDPALLPRVEVKRPGLSAARTWGPFTPGISAAVWETRRDSDLVRDYAAIPNVDYQIGPGTVRASGLLCRSLADADLAFSLALGRFHLDGEGYRQFRSLGAPRAAGYYVGGDVNLWGPVALAFRQDGLFDADAGRADSLRYAAGLSVTLKRELFAATEFAWERGRPGTWARRLAFQLGLKSSLELPGFQRKTLTQE